MAVECTGRNVEVTASLKQLAEERTQRLERHLGGPADVRVVLSHEKHRFGAEIIAIHRRRRWKAQEETADPRAAVALAFEKIDAQAMRDSEKRRDRKHRGWTRFLPKGWRDPAPPRRRPPPAWCGRSRAPSSRWASTRRRWRWSLPGKRSWSFATPRATACRSSSAGRTETSG